MTQESTITTTKRNSEPKSWSEALQKYVNEKQSCKNTTKDSHYEAIFRVTRDKSDWWRNKESAFNPVTGKWRDQIKEKNVELQEEKQSKEQLVKGKEKELLNESYYNIVNLKSKLPSSLDKRVKESQQNDQYDQKEKQSTKQILEENNIILPHHKKETSEHIANNKTKLSSFRNKTDFDPILLEKSKGVPIDDYPERKKKAMEHLKSYREKHFDPILQHFDDQAIEEKESQRRSRQVERKQQIRQNSCPPSYHVRQGAAYDIVAPERKKAYVVPKYEKDLASSLIKHRRNRRLEKEAQKKRLQETNRPQGVMKTNHLDQSIKRGYDVITKKPFDSSKATVKTQISPWDRIVSHSKK